MCGLSVKRAVRRRVKTQNADRVAETYRSPVFVPNVFPHYRSDARLSSFELELVQMVRLIRRGERSDWLIRDGEEWMGRIVVLVLYLPWAAKVRGLW